MERPHHLRHLHYRDERANPHLQHLVNPWAKGDEGCRRRRSLRKAQVVRPSENYSPEGEKGKRGKKGRLISKVLIAHRLKRNAIMKLNFNPPTMILTRAFFARPRGGRHSHAPGCAPERAGLSIEGMRMRRWNAILSEWWRSPRHVANW